MASIETDGAPVVREILTMPELWPEAPYLVVERRRNNRVGDDWCYLEASEDHVEAVVHVAPTWPPPADADAPGTPTFAYDSLEDLQSEGWRPYRSSDRNTWPKRR